MDRFSQTLKCYSYSSFIEINNGLKENRRRVLYIFQTYVIMSNKPRKSHRNIINVILRVQFNVSLPSIQIINSESTLSRMFQLAAAV